jgi:dipeptidyl aminopeptidase/acylaminoacyl peptidase
MDGNGLSRLTEGQGQHRAYISPSGKYFVDTYSAVDTGPKAVLRRCDGTFIRVVEEADISPLLTVGWTPPQEYVVKAADGITDLWVTAYFPHQFDPSKKYPVVEHIYAGPQTLMRPMDFGDPGCARQENFDRALANLGFIVVILDARGTPGRSKPFQDVVYKRWGQFEIADHAGALLQLAQRLGFLDIDRVGIWGASWGGQFAFRALTQAPDVYKVGVCEMPALDLARLMLYETYLGLPQENRALYRESDPFALAPKLKGELLLVGGMNDPYSQADLFKLSETLIRLGKQHRTMIYPNCGHIATGQTAEYNMELKKRFFVEHLLSPSSTRRGT